MKRCSTRPSWVPIIMTLLIALPIQAMAYTERPLVGILSQPCLPGVCGPPHDCPDASYIAASYVKFVEMAGARAVALVYNDDKVELLRRLKAVNLLLFPGGAASLELSSPFYQSAKWLFGEAMKMNADGDRFPVHGTCLGLELLHVIVAGTPEVLDDFDADDAAAPLILTEAAARCRLFQNASEDLLAAAQMRPLAMESHHRGVNMSMYNGASAEARKIGKFFTILSTSLDAAGKEYVSSIESPIFPVTATQWHPEKAAFEFNPQQHIPHSPDAILLAQAVANMLVAEARRSTHAPANEDEETKMLIGRQPLRFTADSSPFQAAYILHPTTDMAWDGGSRAE